MDFMPLKLTLASVFLVLFVLYWAFNFIVLYHLLRFGVGTQPKKIAAIFLLSSVVLSFICASLLAQVDTGDLKFQLDKVGSEVINIKI